MQAVLHTLVSELTRLKAQGVEAIALSQEALDSLQSLVHGAERTEEKSEPRMVREEDQRSTDSSSLRTADRDVRRQTSSEHKTPSPEPPKSASNPTVRTTSAGQTDAGPKPHATQLQPPIITLPEAPDKAARWQWLKDRVSNDLVCKAQARPGKKVVLGVGSLEARIFFVGEAPGAEEEIQGEPFVGPAGQLLTKMISACGLKREDVYIGNIMNWRPQLPVGSDGVQRGNREPTEEEMNYCLPFLRAQIDIVNPALIVALGATAAKGLLGFRAFRTLSEVRSRWHDYLGRPLMVTYHPSYLLHREADGKESARKAKRAAWEDFLLIMEKGGLPISEKQKGFFLNK